MFFDCVKSSEVVAFVVNSGLARFSRDSERTTHDFIYSGRVWFYFWKMGVEAHINITDSTLTLRHKKWGILAQFD